MFDGHNDVLHRYLGGEDITVRRPTGHLDLPRMREGGLDGGIFAVWIDPETPDPLGHTLHRLDRARRFLESSRDFRLVLTVGDLEEARRNGDIAVVLGVEGGYAITDRLEVVDRLHAAGMRCLTLTWMSPTAWADAAGARPMWGGLTDFGGRVVQRLEELGVLIDVSHASDQATRDVLRRVAVPIAASHSGCWAVANHPRNLKDDLLEELAAGGGIVGINFFSAYLDSAYAAAHAELENSLPGGECCDFAAMVQLCSDRLEAVPLRRLIQHISHAARVAGWQHVGLGSDFDGAVAFPAGLRDVRDLPRISAELVQGGVEEGDLTAFLGENFWRLLHAVLD